MRHSSERRLRVAVPVSSEVTWVGGFHYLKTLCRGLRELCDPSYEVVALVRKGDDASRAAIERYVDTIETVQAPVRLWRLVHGAGTRSGHTDLTIEWAAHRAGADCVFLTNLGRSATVPWIGWVWDFQHEDMPEYFEPSDIQWRRDYLGDLVLTAPHVIVSSEHARACAETLYPASRGKTTVVTFPCLEEPSWFEGDPAPTLAKFRIAERFIYMPNQFWAHKNHRTAFLAWANLGAAAPMLVCTGLMHDPRRPNALAELLRTLDDAGAHDRVRMLGLIERREQVDLFRASMAVLNPSLYEGWNTSVEEARLFGKACILSDIPVFREQSPPGARFFSPRDVEQLAGVVREVADRERPGVDVARETRARATGRALATSYGRVLRDVVSKAVEAGPNARPFVARGIAGSFAALRAVRGPS